MSLLAKAGALLKRDTPRATPAKATVVAGAVQRAAAAVNAVNAAQPSPVLQKISATLTKVAPTIAEQKPTLLTSPALQAIPMQMPVLKTGHSDGADPDREERRLTPREQAEAKTTYDRLVKSDPGGNLDLSVPVPISAPAPRPILSAPTIRTVPPLPTAPLTAPPMGDDVSLLKGIAKVATGALRMVPGVGTAIAVGEAALGVKKALTSRPTLPVATQPPMMLQAPVNMMQNSFLPSPAQIGRVGGAIGRTIGRVGSTKGGKWVKSAVGGVITWILVDKVTGAILKQSDRPPTRRMNPMNVKALKRADRRICSFAGISRGVLRDLGYRVESTRRPKGKCSPKRGKRGRCA